MGSPDDGFANDGIRPRLLGGCHDSVRCHMLVFHVAIGDGSQVPRRRGDVGCNVAEWIDARYVARNERRNKEGRKKAGRRKEEKEGALMGRRKGRLLSTPVLRK